MRGGRGFNNHRGSGPSRGSNSYGGRMNSSIRRGQYNYNSGGASGSRYHMNYNGSGNNNVGHYDSRNRDKFNDNTSRHDSGHRRNYRDSRDRSNDRKRSRQEDYRRNSAIDRNNRTPPPPPVISTPPNTSNYRGGNNTSYRGSAVRSGDRQNSSHRNRSPIGQNSKRPQRASYLARQRGSVNSSNRGMRTSIRGGGRIMRRESTDLKIMRRRLLYAQQKDRARVIKIARLTSSLRRRRLARHSKSPSRANTDDQDNKEDDESNSKTKSSSKSKHGKLSTKEDVGNSNNEGGFDDDDENGKTNASKTKKDGESDEVNGANTNNNEDVEEREHHEKDKGEPASDLKKEGKKKETDDDNRRERSVKSSTKKELTKKKSSEQRNTTDDADTKGKSKYSRREDADKRKATRFIKLTCIHCHTKCVTFKEYSQHLYSRTHKTAIRQIALRQRAHLLRLRARQRTAQRDIEENCKEEYDSKFCHLCRLHYRQPKAKHQLSDHHKAMKKFLMPYCSTCHLAFKSPMLYETHRCSLEHIRNKARKRDSDSDNSADEMREIDLNKFLTVDSVGETDENEDFENALNGNEAKESSAQNTQYVGAQYVKKIETYFCELCNYYTPANKPFEDFANKHCKLRSHLKAFLRLKGEERAQKSESDGNSKSDNGKLEQDNPNTNFADAENDKNKESLNSDLDNSTEIAIADDDKLWEDVDKDLGDLLREVEGDGDDEDESVLNIDIESEQHNLKEINALKDELKAHGEPKHLPVKTKLSRVTSNKISTENADNSGV